MDGGVTTGVSVVDATNEPRRILAPLVVGADGRHSLLVRHWHGAEPERSPTCRGPQPRSTMCAGHPHVAPGKCSASSAQLACQVAWSFIQAYISATTAKTQAVSNGTRCMIHRTPLAMGRSFPPGIPSFYVKDARPAHSTMRACPCWGRFHTQKTVNGAEVDRGCRSGRIGIAARGT